MTITNDSIDSAVAMLKEHRDGLRATFMAEEQERAQRTAGLVETAHTWADKNGIGKALEDLMEKLDLPKRPDYRSAKVEGGRLTSHIYLPYTGSSGVHPFDRLESIRYTAGIITTHFNVGEEVNRHRAPEGECVCPTIPSLTAGHISDQTHKAVEDLGGFISIDIEMSCDSPSCNHGYSNFAQVPDPDEEMQSIYKGGIYSRSKHRSLFSYSLPPNTPDEVREVTHDRSGYRLFVWEGGSAGQALPQSYVDEYGVVAAHVGKRSAWVNVYDFTVTSAEDTLMPDGAFIGEPYTRTENQTLFDAMTHQSGTIPDSVTEVREAWFNEMTQPGYRLFVWQGGDAGWGVTTSQRDRHGFDYSLIGWRASWVNVARYNEHTPALPPEVANLGADTANQPCDRTGHPEWEHIHWLGPRGYMSWSRPDFVSNRDLLVKANGTFGEGERPEPEPEPEQAEWMGEDRVRQFCTGLGHPAREHLHWRVGDGIITHSRLDYTPSMDSMVRGNGTYIGVTDTPQQTCGVSSHSSSEHVHVHVDNSSADPLEGSLRRRVEYNERDGWQVHPGTFFKSDVF